MLYFNEELNPPAPVFSKFLVFNFFNLELNWELDDRDEFNWCEFILIEE